MIGKNMKDLWELARQYGLVTLYSQDDGTYHCVITFHTIKHVELKARSTFKEPTVEDAIKAAISKAEEIMASMQAMATANPLRKLLSWAK